MSRSEPIVAIDGAAGSGKSTLAKALAGRLSIAYVNTGLMYRAVTLAALDHGTDLADGPALESLAREINFDLDQGKPPQLRIEGSEPDARLTSAEVEGGVSQVARHPQVRAVLRERQRELGASGAVMEGRDIGSVVFPDADVKIHLSADPSVRERRRAAERESESAQELHVRDQLDAKVNPLEAHPGSVTIDTTDLSLEEALERAMSEVQLVLGTDGTSG